MIRMVFVFLIFSAVLFAGDFVSNERSDPATFLEIPGVGELRFESFEGKARQSFPKRELKYKKGVFVLLVSQDRTTDRLRSFELPVLSVEEWSEKAKTHFGDFNYHRRMLPTKEKQLLYYRQIIGENEPSKLAKWALKTTALDVAYSRAIVRRGETFKEARKNMLKIANGESISRVEEKVALTMFLPFAEHWVDNERWRIRHTHHWVKQIRIGWQRVRELSNNTK